MFVGSRGDVRESGKDRKALNETEDVPGRAVAPREDDGEALTRYRQRFTSPQSAQDYDQRFRTRKSVTHALEMRALGRVLSSLGDLGRVLDVPVGAGRFLGLLGDRAAEVVGADVSTEMLQLARARSAGTRGSNVEGRRPTTFVAADALHLPFAEGSFDAVVCIRLLHHLPSGQLRVDALRELARVSGRYVVVTFFDYMNVWVLRQAWRRLRGKVKLSAIPLARCQAEAARAGLRFVRSVHVLPGVSEEQVLVFAKDPAVAAAIEERPQSVSRRLRVGHWLSATAWLWAVLLGGLIFFCRWQEIEDAELILWPPGTVLMLAGALLLVWTHRSRPSTGSACDELSRVGRAEHVEARRAGEEDAGRPYSDRRGPYALSRHPALLGVTLWLSGFALACELWWMALSVWLAVPGGLWLAIEYAEADRWLRHGHAYELYAQGTPLFLPTAGALAAFAAANTGSSRALPAPEAAPGLPPDQRAGFWSGVGIRALFVAAAGAALALLKELSLS